jgi:hypothetical protein
MKYSQDLIQKANTLKEEENKVCYIEPSLPINQITSSNGQKSVNVNGKYNSIDVCNKYQNSADNLAIKKINNNQINQISYHESAGIDISSSLYSNSNIMPVDNDFDLDMD